MLRALSSPLRVRVPEGPSAEDYPRYRAAVCARTRARARVVLARRATQLRAEDAALLASVDAELAVVRSRCTAHPVERLCATAAPNTAAIEVLGLVASAYLDVEARTVLAQLQADLHAGVDRELVNDLVSGDASDASVEDWIGRGGVFERLGLVEVERLGSGRDLVTITARLRALYDGLLVSDPRLAELVQWRACAITDAVGVIAGDELERLVELTKDVVSCCTPPLAMFVGPTGAGRTRLAQAVAAGLGMRRVALVDAPLLPREPEHLAATLQRIEHDVRFLNGMLVLRGLDTIDPARQPGLAALLARVTVPLVLTTEHDDPGRLEPLVAVKHQVSRPPAALRREAWAHELVAHGAQPTDNLLDHLAGTYSLTRSTIGRAVDLVTSSDRPFDAEALEHAAASQVRSRLDRYAQRIMPKASLSELVLAHDVAEQVDELVHAVVHREQLASRFGDLGPKGIAALFNGPPGTGKTMTAGAIAHTLQMPLYRIDVSSIVDRYVGETEKNLARVFEEAESERGLLLFDEADSLFTKRVAVSDSHDRYANMQVNMLLNLIDDYTGFVILTTNLKASIDSAFLRRMSFKIGFEVPDVAERTALWRMQIPEHVELSPDVDLDQLARRFRCSGGEIRNAVFRALLLTPSGAPVTSASLSRAVALELEASGNVVQREVS